MSAAASGSSAVSAQPDIEPARDAVRQAARAAPGWGAQPFHERGTVLRNVAQLLGDRRDECAELMAREMGKPVREGRAEIEKCARVCEYYAENAKRFLKKQLIDTEASSSYVCFEPLGVVFAIMPWNFPFWQVFRFAAPALMAGNAVVLKHASLVPGCAALIESIVHAAGAPRAVFAQLALDHESTEALIDDDAIAAVTFTGSTEAGRSVAARAGRALKKTVLELGGSDPYLILSDADIELSAEACVECRLINNGQSCISAKRWIAVKSVRRAFQDAVLARLSAQRYGDPLDPETRLGPLASVELRDRLHEQVRASVAGGATLMLGGTVPKLAGAWYPPTLLSNVQAGTPAYSDELFGPVGAIIEAADEEDAIRIANDNRYGLGAAVFCRDRAHAEQIARTRLVAGSCFVNAFVRSDPRLPFGGVKQSGYGRELSVFGIQEFVNVKSVYVR